MSNLQGNAQGNFNKIVQIVGDNNEVTLSGAVSLRLTRYNQKALKTPSIRADKKGDAGYTQTGRRETTILSAYNRESLPFQGRQKETETLQAWLKSEEKLSVQVITGAGGSGKTRLAVRLMDEACQAGWTAGFARKEDLDVFRQHGCRSRWDHPTLVIIDYASTKIEELKKWLGTLATDEDDERPPLRLLLLERTGGCDTAWWKELFDAPDVVGEMVGDLLAEDSPLQVGALASLPDRHAVFAAAYRQASEQNPPPPTPSLDSVLINVSLGGSPLFLAMFGLIAARQGLDAVKSLRSDQIAIKLAEQELLRIRKIWEARGLPFLLERPLHEHLVAAASLCEGLSEQQAHQVIAQESLALSQKIEPGQTGKIFAALREALPAAEGGVAPVLPDILGEAVALVAFGRLPDNGRSVVERLWIMKPVPVTSSVVRTCQDFLIRGYSLPMSWLQVLKVQAADLESLMALANAMPHDTLELREVAAEITRSLLDMIQEIPEDKALSLRAAVLNNYSNRLSDLGQREPALTACEEAVAIYRRLAADRSDAFSADLASSLNNYSNRLSSLGQRESALAACEEAVAIRRRLAADRPDAFSAALASSLNNYSSHLSSLGQRESALAACEEAVAIYRRLAADRPDAFSAALALSLNNYSSHLSSLGQRESALAACEEAVAIYRRLAADRPDAFSADLASSLNNYASHLSSLGQRERALAACEEAVAIYRRLVADRPDAFSADLASSLNNYASHLSSLGQRELALAACEEAVAIYRRLAADRSDAFSADLASSLNNYSNHLSSLGQRESALAACEEAVAIYRRLAADRPDAFSADLASSLNNYASHLSSLGQRESALAACEEAVAIRRRLAVDYPDAFSADLASSLNNYANRLSSLGQREPALAACEEAVAIRRMLVVDCPDAFSAALASSLNNYSNHLSSLGQRESALAACEEAVAIYRRLAADRPDAFSAALALSLNNYANRLSSLGQRESALAACEEAVAIYRRLAADRPDAFSADLVRTLGTKSQILRSQGQSVEAKIILSEALATILPFLQKMPQGFFQLGYNLVTDYFAVCKQSDLMPDEALLDPIIGVLQPLLKSFGKPDHTDK